MLGGANSCVAKTRSALQDLLSEQVAGKTLLEHLAALACASDRLPHADGALLANGAGSQSGVHDVTQVVVPARGDAAGQVQVLLAECLFFASSLRDRVAPTEFASMLTALDGMTHGRSKPTVVCVDSRAIAVLFAVLAALDSGKIAADELEALHAGAQFLPANKHDLITALLRLAFGLCFASSSEAALKAACDDGALQFLLTVVGSPAFAEGTHDWPDAYVIPAHDLVAGFLQDTRAHGGRFQVKCLRETKHAGFPQLIQLLASLYAQGSEDLPLECKPLWDFVDYAIEEYYAERSPSTLMPLLQLLRSLSVAQAAQAHKVWSRLHSSALGAAAPGELICGAMLSYCKLYAGDDFSTSLAQPRSLFQDENSVPIREVNIPNEDVDAMLGYLQLLQQLMDTAPRDFAIDRVQQLELRCFEGQPIMFVLFTLLDLPVQPKLKAALFSVIGSFATEMASAVKIWTFLENAAVRSKPVVETGFYAPDMQHMQDLGTSGPRTDILYELNEVEARAETYVETLAFISLVNKLLDLCECTNCGPAAGGGVAALHIFQFVRDSVFLKMDRRAYKSVTEKWQLTEACLEHFRLAIRLTQGTPPEYVVQGVSAPGQELLQDFENEGPVLRSILSLLHGGAGYLEEERDHAHGLALESCIGEAFTVLHAALPVKAFAVASQGLPRSSNFDVLLLRDRRRLVQLFSFVGYTKNTALQALAVQVVHNLALRNERLLPMALDQATLQHLKKCIVDALDQGLDAELTPGGTALVVFRLLVETLPQQVTPNLAQLLLGFELTPEGGLTLSPFRHEACLALLLNAVRAPWAATDALGTLLLRESVFHIFYLLAADSRTKAPAVAHLREELQLSTHLAGLTARPESTADQTALLHQRAWLLRLASVILHHATEVGDSAALDSGLLQALVVAPSEAPGRAHVPLLQLLDCAAAGSFSPPVLDPAYVHVVDALGLGDALSSNGLVEENELYVRNERGELTLNFIALDALLRQRAAEQECVSSLALAASVRALTRRCATPCSPQPDGLFYAAVLRHALRLNNWRAERNASLRLLEAWSNLVSLLVVERYASLKFALHAPGSAASLMVSVLAAAVHLLPDADDKRAEVLARLCHILLTVLRAETAESHVDQFAGGSFAGTLSPSACHDLLRCLLAGLLRNDRGETTRHFLYAAMLGYLHLCRLPAWAQSPAVLRAVAPFAGAVSFAFSSGAARSELDTGNLVELRRHGGLLMSLLARESTGSSEQGRTQALSLLQAVLSLTEGAGAAFESWLLQSGLPAAVATMVERAPRAVLMLPSPASFRTLQTVEAQLSFLLSVALDTPCGAAHLVACGVVPQLTGCHLIDALQTSEQSEAVRARVFLPALRLLLTLLERLPDSAELALQASAFAQAHSEVLLGALGVPAKDLDASRLQELQSAVQLLCRLCVRSSGPELGRFRVALERLCWSLFGANTRAQPLHHRAQDSAQLSTRLWLVQSTLVGYLRKQALSGCILLPVTAEVEQGAGPPSLLLLAKLAECCSDAFVDVLRKRHAALTGVRAHGGAELVVFDQAGQSSLSASAVELVTADTDARVLLYLLECALQVVHATLQTAAPGVAASVSQHLRPLLSDLGSVAPGESDQDLAFLKLLCRRLRDFVDA